MITEPVETPVTNPVDASTVAIAPSALLHEPAPYIEVVLSRSTVVVAHIGLTPMIVPATGKGLTVIVCEAVAVQPDPLVPVTV
jgi:ketopantoate hydroxymethyltransferase